MSSFYYLYQAYQAQLYNAIVGLAIVGVALVISWYAIMLLIAHGKLRNIIGWVYCISCTAIYAVLIMVFVL